MLKNDMNMYNAVKLRLNELVGDCIGEITPVSYNWIYRYNDTISYAYNFKENEGLVLYLKDTNNKINIEIKKFINKSCTRAEIEINADMTKANDIIIKLYENITEEIDVSSSVDNLFNIAGQSNNQTSGDNSSNIF